jgi:CIC family chloride channel protein
MNIVERYSQAVSGAGRWSRWRGAYLAYPLTGETRLLVLLAVAIGIGSGLGAYGFRWLIGFVHRAFWETGGSLVPWPPLVTVLTPALGGALVGPIIYWFAREAKGHGVPEVMLAIAEEGGRIRPRVVFVKALASAICLGSGGSAGREGPIVQIGSALGSSLGQTLKLPTGLLRTLLAAGAAGGIAATFNAPIAGVVFSLEVLLRDFSARAFSLLVLASVTATVISRALLGNAPAFSVPPYELVSPWELLFYAVLGVAAALVARGFIWLLYRCEDLFDGWAIPEYLKPVVGGLGVGLIGLGLPQVFGVGYDTVEQVLQSPVPVWLLGALVVGKLAATSLTLGSGGSGGVFSPSLFMGAALGRGVGEFFRWAYPGVTAFPGAYALVGMAAMFSGAAHAPITSVLILFEMTGDYRIILPLMTSVVISTLVSHFLSGETIYTIKLRRRGIDILKPPAPDPLAQVKVSDVMRRDVVTLAEDVPFDAVVDHVRTHPYTSFPVIDRGGRLRGVLGYNELRGMLTGERPEPPVLARDLMRAPPPVCYPDDTLTEVTEKFRLTDIGRLPVVSRDDPDTIVGVISHTDVLGAYERIVLGQIVDASPRNHNQADDGNRPADFVHPPPSPAPQRGEGRRSPPA